MRLMTRRPVQAIDSSTLVAANAPPSLPPLRMEYAFVDPAAALVQNDVLATIGFGAAAPSLDDPRWLRVALEPARAAPLEIWRSRGSITHGTDGALRWASDGDYTFLALEIGEADHGGIAATTQAAYALLSRWRQASVTPHFLRLWNYLDAINAGEGDDERYRQFCSGRAVGMDAAFAATYPAATAIGVRDGRRVLQIYALAARLPGSAVENPRQLNAWRYPRQYGPAAPGFARGMRAPTPSAQLYISGTAAIVGHASHHAEDASAQLDETLANLDALLAAAGNRTSLGAGSLLKVYLRRAADEAAVHAGLRARLGKAANLLLLHGDICRRELLLEIDGAHTD
jgi:chorismate lyase/3-hydroxybenzoate synthase